MYKKKILGLITIISFCGVVFCNTVLAENIALKANHPDRYVVVKGDTLWDISEHFLRDPWFWPNIWQANPQIKNPHLIYPGDVIRLVYVDGKPRLVVDRGRPLVKMSPQGRVSSLQKAIPTIPLDIIHPFLTKPRIVGKNELDNAPYMVQSDEEHLIAAAGNRIYVRGIKDEGVQRYVVVRKGATYTDPETNEVLGYEAIYVGDAVLQIHGDPSTLKLLKSNREVLIGDRMLPVGDETQEAFFHPGSPKDQVEGRILAVIGGVNQIGTHQVVVINRGTREGLVAGNVLAIYQTGNTIKDRISGNKTVKLPDEKAGLMMVFRTFEKLSYALVMRANRNMHVQDTVRNP